MHATGSASRVYVQLNGDVGKGKLAPGRELPAVLRLVLHHKPRISIGTNVTHQLTFAGDTFAPTLANNHGELRLPERPTIAQRHTAINDVPGLYQDPPTLKIGASVPEPAINREESNGKEDEGMLRQM